MDDIQLLTPERVVTEYYVGHPEWMDDWAQHLHINRKTILTLPAGGIDSWGEAPDDKVIETLAQQEIDTGREVVDNWFKQYARNMRFTRDGFK